VTIHLSILLFFPLVLATLGAFAPRAVAPLMLLVGSLVSLAYAVLMLFDFEGGSARLQYITNDKWIPELGIRYMLGVDGLNLWLLGLTTLLFAATALWLVVRPPAERVRLYAFHVGLAETAVLGAFMAQDLILFVLFFDLMLVPFYFLIGQWGGPDRVAATFKLVVYTLVGSLLMLAAAVATGITANGGESFSIPRLAAERLDVGPQRWIFVAFALAFLIKMPAFPFHGWMPDGYRNMPLPVLAVFSAVLSKVAAYGFLRVVLPVFPDATEDFQTVMLLIALASILYGSAQAFTQTNTRLIVGYSSVAQLGFITLGIFALGEAAGSQGALLQMLNHGLVVAPLFFIILLLQERTGSEDLREMGGVAFRAPVFSALFLIVAFATLAMPGSANFAGEFLILLGLFNAKIVFAIIASTGVVLASVYMLRMFIRAIHNRVGPNVRSFDLGARDALVLVPLVLVILAFAVYPQQALDDSEASVERVVRGQAGAVGIAQRGVAP
jgi:NADH-quinone oxidoreductase subunit M